MNFGLLGWAGQRPHIAERGPFSPIQVAGLVLWLRADGITGLADASPISSWPDASGQGNTCTATVGPLWRAAQINGLPCANFNGSTQVLRLPAAFSAGTNNTMFWVIRPTATAFGGLLDSSPGASNSYRNQPAGSWEWWNGQPVFALNAPDITPQLHVFTASLAPSRQVIYERNDAAIGTYTNASTTAMAWASAVIGNINGAAPWYSGDLAELLIYNTALALADRQQVARYLGWKYGITVA